MCDKGQNVTSIIVPIIVPIIKKYISLNLDEKIYQIVNDREHAIFLTSRNIIDLLNFMNYRCRYSISLIEYVYTKFEHRYLMKSIEKNINKIITQACFCDRVDILRFFFSKDIREMYPCIDSYKNNGSRLLNAIQQGHFEIIKFLLEDEKIGNSKDIIDTMNGNLPIKYVSFCGNVDILKYLISDKIVKIYPDIDLSIHQNDLIIDSCAYNKTDILRFLLELPDDIAKRYPHVDPSDKNNFAIVRACENGYLDVLKILLSEKTREKFRGIDPTVFDNRPLIAACMNNKFDVVKFLLSPEIVELYPKIDPSAQNNTAMKFAEHMKYSRIVEILSKEKRVIDKN